MTVATEKLEPASGIEDFVADVDTGGRAPRGAIPRKILFFIPLAWTLFQLWYASPLPFIFKFFVLNDTEARAIHLAFAMFLAYTAFPAFKSSPKSYIPLQDWFFALAAAFCAGYIFLFYDQLATRPGRPTTIDLVIAVSGILSAVPLALH